MKKIIAVSLIGALMLTIAPTANAINKEWSAVAGFVGGVLVANAFDGGSHCAPRTVYYEQRPVEYHYYEPSGRWEYRTERVWVPGRWQYSYDHCGNQSRYWQSGYYRTYQTKTWVSYNR